ncbi:phospholipase D-like domain-containing protein [Micromonospora sp. DT62]|uniref:phospholipase D-like domain-containing protein n=1 Tax=Micromonospora sp. DT62 TaxID=3416521 RepID=UPI003CE8D6A5
MDPLRGPVCFPLRVVGLPLLAGNAHAALHAKLIAADSRVALISSANLTDRALSHNIEVGVVLHDPEVARKLVAHFQALTDSRTGVLQQLNK